LTKSLIIKTFTESTCQSLISLIDLKQDVVVHCNYIEDIDDKALRFFSSLDKAYHRKIKLVHYEKSSFVDLPLFLDVFDYDAKEPFSQKQTIDYTSFVVKPVKYKHIYGAISSSTHDFFKSTNHKYLFGPSGSGKTDLAEDYAKRNKTTLIVLSLSMPDELFTAQLCGAGAGAWTGLDQPIKGALQQAVERPDQPVTILINDFQHIKSNIEKERRLYDLLDGKPVKPLLLEPYDMPHNITFMFTSIKNQHELEEDVEDFSLLNRLNKFSFYKLLHFNERRLFHRREIIKSIINSVCIDKKIKRLHLQTHLIDMLAKQVYKGSVREVEGVITKALEFVIENGYIDITVFNYDDRSLFNEVSGTMQEDTDNVEEDDLRHVLFIEELKQLLHRDFLCEKKVIHLVTYLKIVSLLHIKDDFEQSELFFLFRGGIKNNSRVAKLKEYNRLKNKYALKTIQYSDVKHLFETTEKERHKILDKILKECDIQVTYPFFKYALTMNKDDIIFLLRQTQKHKIEVVKKDYKERSEIAKQLGITPNKLHSLMQVLG